MAGLTRLPFAPTATALYNPSAPTVFSAMTPENTYTFTIPVSRSFKPFRQTRVYFPLGLPSGVILSNVNITGSAQNYSANFSLHNGTSSVIVPATQPIILYQEG